LDVHKAYPATYRSAIMCKLGALINKLPGANAGKQSKTWRIIKKMYDNVTSTIRVTGDGVEVDLGD